MPQGRRINIKGVAPREHIFDEVCLKRDAATPRVSPQENIIFGTPLILNLIEGGGDTARERDMSLILNLVWREDKRRAHARIFETVCLKREAVTPRVSTQEHSILEKACLKSNSTMPIMSYKESSVSERAPLILDLVKGDKS